MGHIGEEIREIRKEKNIRQDELAKDSEITKQYLCDIEKGRANPSHEVVERIFVNLGYDFKLIRSGPLGPALK